MAPDFPDPASFRPLGPEFTADRLLLRRGRGFVKTSQGSAVRHARIGHDTDIALI